MLKTVRSTVNVDQITGVLPVVNGGTGVTTSTGTVSVVLSAAPTLSGNVSLSTGNLVISTSGQGIDFSATPGTGTSELLADYEEGDWTPANATTLTTASGTYIKIGSQITCWFIIAFPVTANGGDAIITGLPFAVKNGGNQVRGGAAFGLRTDISLSNLTLMPNDGTSQMAFRLATGGAGSGATNASNAQVSTFLFIGSVSYVV